MDGVIIGQCDKPLTSWSLQTLHPVPALKLLGLCSELDVGPPLFTLLQSEMQMDGAKSDCWCDQPLTKEKINLSMCIFVAANVLC